MDGTSRHVVLGAGGTGLSVVEELVRRGRSVSVVTRSGKAPVPDGVDVIAGDVADADLVRDACRGAAVVYHCVNPPYHRWLELFPRIHTAIIEGVTGTGARMVMADNLYMYGRPAGETMTEETKISPVSSKGRLRAAMAQELLDAHRQGKLEVAIGRASDYFGPYGQGSTWATGCSTHSS